MDINKLFRAGNTACGRVMSILPENEIGSPKQLMMEVLKDTTLPSLNELYPRLYRTVLSTADLIPMETSNELYVGYRVPLRLTQGLEMMGIRSLHTGMGGFSSASNCQPTGYLTGSAWLSAHPNKYGRYSSANLYETAISANMAYADLQLMGTLTEAPIPRFEAPNIIWLNKSYQSAITFYVVLLLKNDENLISIPDSVYEGVKRLFILDLKNTIYDRYGILSNMETALGNLDLKIDDWANAGEQRNELYDQYHSMAHIRKHTIISG